MYRKIVNFFHIHYEKQSTTFVFSTILLLSFFIRFPFFFRDYVDRDESTFILIGQAWVDGFLPYTELWDIKPPLTFLFFAGIISLFGKSFFAIRLAGTFLVAITAFFSYKIISAELAKKQLALWAALSCVLLLSLFGSIQGVMSEHICMAFLTPGIYMIIRHKNWYSITLSGLLMGIAVMVKLNMAYTLLFLGLYLIFFFVKRKEYVTGVLRIALYGIGILFIILLTLLPYYSEGLHELWWKSVVLAPLDYSSVRRFSLVKLVPLFAIILVFLIFVWRKKYLDFRNTTIQILLIALFGVLYSFIKGGRINGHYLIQLYPILIPLVALGIKGFSLSKNFKLKKVYLAILLLLPAESYLEYYMILKNKVEAGSFYNGEGITVPLYMSQNNLDTNNTLFLGYHIGYWMLDERPPTKAATHPSNICKSEMFSAYNNPRKTGLEEIRYIMEEINPPTVVIRKNRSIFDPKLIEENTYINARLKNHYKPPITVDKAEIYIRSTLK